MIRMSREECINALAYHARIEPRVTLTGITDLDLNLDIIYLIIISFNIMKECMN